MNYLTGRKAKTAKITIELFDLLRYALISCVAGSILALIAIPTYLFVLPELTGTDIMALLNISNPDNVAGAVLDRSVHHASIIVGIFWATYIPRIIFKDKLSMSSRETN
ncbi:MAG: hypothetical protein CMF12_08540 [Idiomarina sp.]|uniref:hypothetical protein n=1 Tax=Idiomarina sp. TaxID=1874361 RepID=UPI000C4F8B18|nr:hypothetical protein [Idiomarina sp.]MBT42557.1 hypothetical protein [Idiomarina sp.]|tara:strand:+ start:573 stop:899 length:327 start_codon:yes stop_codon:yes gene_type:complete